MNALYVTTCILLFLVAGIQTPVRSEPSEIDALKKEIGKQEEALAVLKTKLDALEKPSVDMVEIQVDADGIRTQGRASTREELVAYLKEQPKNTPIVVRAHATLAHSKLIDILNACSEAGQTNIALIKPVDEFPEKAAEALPQEESPNQDNL